jgi:hypothetical protein
VANYGPDGFHLRPAEKPNLKDRRTFNDLTAMEVQRSYHFCDPKKSAFLDL